MRKMVIKTRRALQFSTILEIFGTEIFVFWTIALTSLNIYTHKKPKCAQKSAQVHSRVCTAALTEAFVQTPVSYGVTVLPTHNFLLR